MQPLQRRQRDVAGAHLEVVTQAGARVAAPEAVGAEPGHRPRQVVGDQRRQHAQVVGGGNEHAALAGEGARHVRLPGLLTRMQQVVALRLGDVPVELLVAGDAPHVGGNPELREQLRGLHRLVEDGAAAEQVCLGQLRIRVTGAEPVQAAQDALAGLRRRLRHRRHRVVLVHDREVVEALLLVDVHAADAVLDDHRKLVRVGGVIGAQRGNGQRGDVAVAVLMLQPLAVEGGAAGGAAQKEALATQVGRRPDQVADPLEAEHRVVDEERDGVHPVRGVCVAGGDEGRERAGLGDAFLQHLAVLGLLVVEQVLPVHGFVELPDARVDAHLPEQRLHAEGARLVRDDRHDQRSHLLVAQQLGEDAHESHGARRLAAVGAVQELREQLGRRRGERRGAGGARGQVAAQLLAPGAQIGTLPAMLVGKIEGGSGRLLVGDGDIEPRAEGDQLVLVELLLLVGDVLAFARLSQAVALDRLCQDHRGRAAMVYRRLEGRVHLGRIVAAPVQLAQFVVRVVLDQIQEARIGAEEVLADVGARLDGVLLVLAVDGLLHAPAQQSVAVRRQQRVPVGAPDYLDHVPAGAAEGGLKLLDDLAVAAHRPVEALQVAVDHEDQIVQPLAGRQSDRTHRLRFVHLAVAQEGPDLLLVGLLDPAILQVAVEPRLVDRLDGAQAHGDGREGPEVRHQPRMRVGRQAAAGRQLAPEVGELRFAQAALQERPRVHAGGGMPLEIDLIAALRAVRTAQELVLRHLDQRGGRREGADVSADALVALVGPHHHGHGVPADDALVAPLDRAITGVGRLTLRRDGVDVGSVGGKREVRVDRLRVAVQGAQHLMQPLGPAGPVDVVERLHPLAELDVGGLPAVAAMRERRIYGMRHGSRRLRPIARPTEIGCGNGSGRTVLCAIDPLGRVPCHHRKR